jgi:S1-C subfamily serine protease
VVTFDFAQSAIYLRPGKQCQRKERYNLAGIGIIRSEGKTMVHRVDESGAAYRAGLNEGDEILDVDGLPADRVSVFELARMFATAGSRRVRFARQGEGSAREATVNLVDPDDQRQAQRN